jgi:hypothetical protein
MGFRSWLKSKLEDKAQARRSAGPTTMRSSAGVRRQLLYCFELAWLKE